MTRFLNNRDRQNRAEFDKMLARCVRVVEAQPNLATLRLCESVCVSLTTLLENIRLTLEDRPRKNDLVLLRDRIQELSFDRANESMNAPRYNAGDTARIDSYGTDDDVEQAEDDDETQIFSAATSPEYARQISEAAWGASNLGDILMTDIGTEAPDFPIDVLKDTLRTVVGRLREASTKGDVTPYTLATIAGSIDAAVSEFDKEVGS